MNAIKNPKYPKQIKSITNGTTFFYAEAEFNPTTQSDLENGSVLDIMSNSKVGLYLFNSDDKASVKYNIEAETADYIFEKSKICLAKGMNSSAEDGDLSPAYKVRFKGGKLAGKTPAELLLEKNPQTNYQALSDQYQYLSNQPTNSKFAAMNRQQMEAIQDAVTLYQNGKLVRKNIDNAIVIYSGVKTPNVQTVDQRGLTKVRTISMNYLSGEKECFQISIMNGMAPPAGELVGAKLSEVKDKVAYTMKFNEEQWFVFWNAVCKRIKEFESLVAPKYFNVYANYKDAWKQTKNNNYNVS